MPRRKRARGKKPKRRRRHPYNVEQSLPIRAANYHELQMREHYIDMSEKIRFDVDDLKEFEIKAVEIDLNSPSLPFFRRYPGFLPTVDEKFMSQKFPTFEEPPVGTSKPEDDIELGLDRLKLFFEDYYFRWLEYMLPLGLTHAAQDRAVDKLREYDWDGEEHLCAFPVPKPLRPLYEYPRWFATDFDGDSKQHEPFPHLRIRITHETNGDDRLLRGELLGIMRTMTGRFKQKAFSNHCVIPVLAWSLMGPQHARMLVSYIEGDDLVVGYSKLYDFRTRDDCSILLFMRWLLCTAHGITRENQKVLRSNS